MGLPDSIKKMQAIEENKKIDIEHEFKEAVAVLGYRAPFAWVDEDHFYITAMNYLSRISRSSKCCAFSFDNDSYSKKTSIKYDHHGLEKGLDDIKDKKGIVYDHDKNICDLLISDGEKNVSAIRLSKDKDYSEKELDMIKKITEYVCEYEEVKKKKKDREKNLIEICGEKWLHIIDGTHIEKQVNFQFRDMNPEAYELCSDKEYGIMCTKIIKEKNISSGGMGGVDLVIEQALNGVTRVIARKTLLDPEKNLSPEGIKQFTNEMRIAIDLIHPNIVNVYDTGIDFIYDREEKPKGKKYFFLMEYVKGKNLKEMIDPTEYDPDGKYKHKGRDLKMPEHVFAKFIRGIADAMRYAHNKNITHRDIKPENILLSLDNKIPKLADFGLACFAKENEKQQIAGTPRYMSPEQAKGDLLDEKTDIFSLGSVMYFALSGGKHLMSFDPRARTTIEIIQKVADRRQDDINAKIDELEIDPRFKEIIKKCCTIDKHKRFDDDELILRLDNLDNDRISSYIKNNHHVFEAGIPSEKTLYEMSLMGQKDDGFNKLNNNKTLPLTEEVDENYDLFKEESQKSTKSLDDNNPLSEKTEVDEGVSSENLQDQATIIKKSDEIDDLEERLEKTDDSEKNKDQD